MEAYYSKVDGLDYEAILQGFSAHRTDNERNKREVRQAHHRQTTLINRARFAALRGQREVPQENRTTYVDRKVWSA